MPSRLMSTVVLVTGATVAVVPALVIAPLALAAPADKGAKVRICHRTSAVTNPYVSIEVAQSAVDGDAGNDKGQGDHYLTHTGPVWTATLPKGANWGDIIPPIPGVHDGRNWTALGQAIWSAGCRPAATTDADDDGTPDVVDSDDDGDGTPDVVDTDDDGDGIPDEVDPDSVPAVDTDQDGIPDVVDSDDDGDGVVDDSQCELKAPESTDVAESTEESEPAGDATQSGEPETTDGPESTDERASRGAPRVACADDGTVLPPREDEADTDGDGRPNSVDADDDGDGIPDVTDPDQDGDGIPDESDADDDGDGVPDPLDEDDPTVEPSSVVDTDGDGTPDSRDRDDDGDGVPDVRDRDADGDGRPEVTPQPLAAAVVLPARIESGEPVVLWSRALRTVSGAVADVRVSCRSMFRGDVVVSERSLCDIAAKDRRGVVTVTGVVPTVVTVVVTASAVGDYRALRDVRTYRVIP